MVGKGGGACRLLLMRPGCRSHSHTRNTSITMDRVLQVLVQVLGLEGA
jgi:hypothetical protein